MLPAAVAAGFEQSSPAVKAASRADGLDALRDFETRPVRFLERSAFACPES